MSSRRIFPSPSLALPLAERLSAPFDPSEVKFKPQVVKGNRALALAYVDARAIMDRLDEVLGVENWQDRYELLPDNSVMCRLRVRIDGQWISKSDVGSPSEQPDGGDRLKAAFSDALKRTAVKLGIGRYLYRLPQQWADYDAQKRQFVTTPQLPDWATAAKPAKQPREKKSSLPADGSELHRRLRAADAAMASRGECPVGALLAHVTQAGMKAGFGPDLNQWVGPAIELAAAETRAFKARVAATPDSKTVA
jgi:Rad52/22 family double-strand break repair protein